MINIVDYGSGNVYSVHNAFHAAGLDVRVSNDPADIAGASHVVLPGVGSFGAAMEKLRERELIAPLTRAVIEERKPFLGICVGMQVLGSVGTEFGNHPGLGWIPGAVDKIDTSASGLRLPHVGWNTIDANDAASPLLHGLDTRATFYYVHTYQLLPEDASTVTATSAYGVPVTAMVTRGNIFGVQFHPEKSQGAGIRLLQNFAAVERGAV